MNQNVLTIQINKPVDEVFTFTITPPNSTLWIPGITIEETNDKKIAPGTIYTLGDDNSTSSIIVSQIKQNEFVEWVTEDGKFHCRYTFNIVDPSTTKLTYYEWVEEGNLKSPFTQDVLEKLKSALENS